MSDLTGFRDHARRMATAVHRPTCQTKGCGGCVSADDRALWLLLAAEVDNYLTPPPIPDDWQPLLP